jgi:hypothetical protein
VTPRRNRVVKRAAISVIALFFIAFFSGTGWIVWRLM